MLNLRALLGRLFGDALAQRRRRPGFIVAIPVLGTLLHPLVARVAPRRRLSAISSATSLALAAVVVRLCARPDPASTPMCAFIPKYHCGLMHLRVPCAAPVLRRRA